MVIHRRSLAELAAAVRSGELAAREVVAHHLDRSEALQPQLNAYTLLDRDGALRRAASIDDQLVAGDDPGPLAGVPVAIKDLIDQAGLPTTCGSAFYRQVPEHSAPVVERLEAAGAVILGRTGLHEWAFGFSSENDWFGPVRNPWDTATSPGGSSGGSAAAAAAGLAAGTVGTDTGGSVRVPAALCGVVGLKVTHGRVPLSGVFPLAPSLDTVGPLGRSAADVALLYQVMAGHEASDPWSVPQAVTAPERSREDVAGTRAGIPQPWVEAAPATEAVRAAFAEALTRLANAGVEIREVRSEVFEPAAERDDLANAEVAVVHREFRLEPENRYGPEVEQRLQAVYEVTLDRYVAAQAWRARLRNALAGIFAEVDVLVTPAVAATRKLIGEPTITVAGEDHPYRPVLSWFSALVNHMGGPALVLPLASPGDPPPALQLIGPPWSEHRLLELGHAMEGIGVAEFRPPPAW